MVTNEAIRVAVYRELYNIKIYSHHKKKSFALTSCYTDLSKILEGTHRMFWELGMTHDELVQKTIKDQIQAIDAYKRSDFKIHRSAEHLIKQHFIILRRIIEGQNV